MQWWNDFVDWLFSDDALAVLTAAVVPFVAIVVAGVVAAWIGRGATRRVLAHHDRELKAAAVTALIGVGRKAAAWSTLGAEEHQRVDFIAHEAEVRVRLLPLSGASLAADWAVHQLADMKRNSVSFSFQAEQTLLEYRDRLIEWQYKPSRARKIFVADLERWRFEQSESDKALVEKQQNWAQEQLAVDTGSVAAQKPAATPTKAFAPRSAPAVSAATTSEPQSTPEDSSAGLVDDNPTPPAADGANDRYVRPTPPIATVASTTAADAVDADDRSPFSPPVTAQSARERIVPEPKDPEY